MRVRAVVAALVAAVLVVLSAAAGSAAAGSAAIGSAAAGSAAAGSAAIGSAAAQATERDPRPGRSGGPVVLVGVPGLRWAQVSAATTPAIWELAERSALATMPVRGVYPRACPIDAWLTLNAGRRAGAARADDDGDCPSIPVPNPGPAAGSVMVPGWSTLTVGTDGRSYRPRLGVVAEAAGLPRCAVGPGAAIALADAGGRVGSYAEDLGGIDLTACPLTVVDAAAVPAADVLSTVPPDATVVLAGIADRDPGRTHLSAVAYRQPPSAGAPPGPRLLHSGSTRRDGLVTLPDLTATVLAALDAPVPEAAAGSVLSTSPAPSATAGTVADLARVDTAAQTVRDGFVGFYLALVAGQALLLGGFALARWRRPPAARWATIARAGALGFAAVPLSSFLVNLLPWERAAHPGLAVWPGVAGVSVAVAAVSLAGPWRHRPFGPPGVIAAATVVTMSADVMTGSTAQLNSPFGLSPLIAGRFYGFGNVAFAVFAMAALLTAAWAAVSVRERHGRRAGASVAAALGAGAVLVDGWPGFGADFGGVLALVPGVAVLALGAAAVRMTASRVAGIVALAVLTVSVLAVLDWARPADRRSHLGDFVQDVLDGEAREVIGRKLAANLDLLTAWPALTVALPALVAALFAAVIRPPALRLGWLAAAYTREPVLRPLLLSMLVSAVVGFAVNDSGIIVPAAAMVLAVPLGAAVLLGTAPGPDADRGAGSGAGLRPGAGANAATGSQPATRPAGAARPARDPRAGTGGSGATGRANRFR